MQQNFILVRRCDKKKLLFNIIGFLFVFIFYLTADVRLSFSSEVAVSDTDEILVTATRVEKNIHDIPAGVEIIDESALKNANVLNVDELFKSVSGVDLQGSGFPGSEIKLNFRGLTTGRQSKRVLVLIDGRRFNEPYEGNAEFSLLPTDNIERIEVVKGPASALYGSNAMAGVINIITKKGHKISETKLKAAGGEYGTYNAYASNGWEKGPFDYFLTGSHVQTNGYMNNSDGTDRDWEAQNFSGNFGWTFNKDSEFRFHTGYYSGGGTDENSDRDVRKDYQSMIYKLKWDPAKNADLLIRLYRNHDYNKYDWKYPGEGIYNLSTYCGEIQQSMRVGERQLVVAGFENRRDDVNVEEVSQDIDKYSTVTALYFQNEIHVLESLALTAGIRIDHDEDYGNELSPHIGILLRLSEISEIWASANRAHRAPSLSDRYVKVIYNNLLFEGNPDLKPETVTSYELGGRRRLNEKANIELIGFYNKMKDSFDFMLDPDFVFRNRNVTKTTTYGFEGDLDLKINDKTKGFFNFSYTKGTYDKFPQNPVVEGNQLAYLAEKKLGLGIYFIWPNRVNHFVLCRYNDHRYGDAQNTIQNKMDAYITADWHGSIKLSDTMRITFNIDNIFNASYEEFPNQKQLGRFYLLGIEKEF